MTASSTGYTVLVVEDDLDHTDLIEIAFTQLHPNVSIAPAWSAEEAIAYLRGPDTDQGRASLPDVIVLDINMPGIGGLGFLEWYGRQARAIRDIPVVVFTSSVDPQLGKLCFELGAREYKVKPADFGELVDVVHRVLDHWRPEREADSA